MILLLILVSYILFIFINYIFTNITPTKENYQSLTDCLNQGYPNDFCINTPIQSVISDKYCNCSNGQLGTYKFNNQCFCYPFDPLQPYYTEKIFNDYLN